MVVEDVDHRILVKEIKLDDVVMLVSVDLVFGGSILAAL